MNRSEDHMRAYNRGMMRSAVVSLFWAAIADRKKRGGFTFQALAKALGRDKSAISRWFSADAQPNWSLDTIADIAEALNLDLQVTATDRVTGAVYGSTGVRHAPMGLPAKPVVTTTVSGDRLRITKAPEYVATWGTKTRSMAF